MGGISRRDFLRGGAVGVAASVAAPGSAPALADEAAHATQAGPTDRSRAVPTARTAAVHECDVLVVGGGIAGMEAALRVVSQGRTAFIVDKGVFGHSGTSGINWGHTYQSMELSPNDDATVGSTVATMSMVCEGLINQPYFYAMLKASYDQKTIANALKYGSIPLYNEDGTVLSHNEPYEAFPVVHDQGFWPRFMAQWCRRNGNVTRIFENTFVVDYLTSQDGRAAGAVAIDMTDGSAHVFRAKAVVMATGSYCWIAGWNGMGAETDAGKECTGDGTAMLLRHGVPMVDMEQFCGDAPQWTPAGVRQTMGNFNYDAAQTPYSMVFDKDMVPFDEMLAPLAGQYYAINMGNTAKIMWGLRLNGRTTGNGGVFVDKSCAPAMPRYFRRSEERELLYLGYELPQYFEVVPEVWDSAGCPRDLSSSSETVVPGLFYAGAAPGGVGGMTQIACQSGAWLAANGALSLCDELAAAPSVDDAQVDAVLVKAYAPLSNEAEEPLRPVEVMREVQRAFWPRETGPMRDEAGCESLIAELERIIAEDLPRVSVADQSTCMNVEWRDALEVESMAWCALGSAYASLTRKETRGYNLRTDFPDTDNSYGLANTVVAYGGEGAGWSAEMAPLHDELVPAETLAQMVPTCFGLNTFAR